MKGARSARPGRRRWLPARQGCLWGLALATATWTACVIGTWRGVAWSVQAAGAPVKLTMPRWPWGPRVQVGERTFRIDARPDPRRPVRLVLWDVAQPSGPGRSTWKAVLEESITSLRQTYPALEVELRLLTWQELDIELEQALRQEAPPDVLGTPETTYVYDPRWQVPLEGYLAHALDPQVRAELLPGAASLAASGDRLWGLPRWVEWTGWAARHQGGGARLAVDLANPLLWRMLVLTAAPPADGLSPTRGSSIWSAGRLREAQRWLEGLRPHLVRPARVAELGPVELLMRGEAVAGGPVTGRLAYRLGLWADAGAGSARAEASSALALAGMLAAQGLAAQLPGPLISASSYVVFAPPQADDARLRLAWELAVALARHGARALAGAEGVIPAWNPQPQPLASRGRRSGRTPQAGEPAWWEQYPFPPEAREALVAAGDLRGGRPQAAGGATRPRAVAGGALDWSDGLHEQNMVARWAFQLASGRIELDEFVRRVGR